MKTHDGPVGLITEQSKSAAGKVIGVADDLFRSVVGKAQGVHYEPHPTRRRIIDGLLFGIPMLFAGAGFTVGWMRKRSQS